MAFLLSPKTGGGVTYALHSNQPVSINGGAAQTYTEDNPGTVKPGDVLTASASMSVYYWATPDPGIGDDELKTVDTGGTYTVEAVPGAVYIDVRVVFS